MISPEWISIIIVGGEVAVILVLTLLVFLNTSSSILRPRVSQTLYENLPEHRFYEDEDGEAVKESLASYNSKFSSLSAAICASIGLVVSLAGGAWSILDSHRDRLIQQWLQVGGWVSRPIVLASVECLD